MPPLEEKLRNALCREAAPEGFADRVLARTRREAQPGAKVWWQFRAFVSAPLFRWALTAAAVCVVIAGGLIRHQRQDRLRQKGELARVQVRQALHIASVKLNVTRKRVQDINREAPSSRL
jgi:hypothetical protein